MKNKIKEGEIFQTEFEKIAKRIDEKISELYKTLELIISNIEKINEEAINENESSLHQTMLSIERRLHILCSSIKI